MKARAVLALGVLAIGACATLKNALVFQQPDIQLKQINVTGLGLTGGTLDLVFDVFNPNDYRLRSTRLEVGLDLESVHFGDALLERPLDLSPTNHNEVIVPLRFEWAGVSAGARGLLTRQAVKFGLNGAVIVETPLGERRVGLQASGDVPLRKFF